MKKIRTLIVDDEALARERLKQLLEREPEVEIVGVCPDGAAAVAAIRRTAPDLVFLDVQMPELDGFGVVESIHTEPGPVIVFVTAHDRFALRAFEIHAVDYLLKPFDRERFQKALYRGIERAKHRENNALLRRQAALITELKSAHSQERVAVKSGSHRLWLQLGEIDWISAADNYCELHVGTKSYLLRETLSSLEARLDPAKFVRVSRSVIVHSARIKQYKRSFYGGGELVLQNGTRLALSRRYRGKLKQLGLD